MSVREGCGDVAAPEKPKSKLTACTELAKVPALALPRLLKEGLELFTSCLEAWRDSRRSHCLALGLRERFWDQRNHEITQLGTRVYKNLNLEILVIQVLIL